MTAKEANKLTKESIPGVIESEIKSISEGIYKRASYGYFFLDYKKLVQEETIKHFESNGFDVEKFNTFVQFSWDINSDGNRQ